MNKIKKKVKTHQIIWQLNDKYNQLNVDACRFTLFKHYCYYFLFSYVSQKLFWIRIFNFFWNGPLWRNWQSYDPSNTITQKTPFFLYFYLFITRLRIYSAFLKLWLMTLYTFFTAPPPFSFGLLNNCQAQFLKNLFWVINLFA